MASNQKNQIYPIKSEKNFLLVITILFLLLTLFMLLDLASIIVYSLLIAYFLYPLYKFYIRKVGDERISSILSLLTFTLVICVPFGLFSYFVILNLIKILLEYRIYIENPDILNQTITQFMERITGSQALSSINLAELFNTFVVYVIEAISKFFSSIPTMVFYFFIMLFISYYALVYNKKMFKAANDYIPLGIKKQNEIIESLDKNLKVLFKGYFLTGIIQTAVALFGYIIFGAPNIMLLTVLTFVLSLIPYLGTPLVFVPVSMYMIISGNQIGGIGLLIYGTMIISTVDNFIRPYLMSTKETISPPLVFVGFIGGVLAFGISGFILGPLIIAITTILLKYLKDSFEIKDE